MQSLKKTKHLSQLFSLYLGNKPFFMQFVYLLKCADNTTYTGCTQNIEERLKRNKKKQMFYTSSRLPVKLITYIAFRDKHQAFQFEKHLKSGSGNAFSNKRFL